jgi:hypothetical protein
MMMEMAFASWETIGRRGQMMARGKCSPAEYSRMVLEKVAATTAFSVRAFTVKAHARLARRSGSLASKGQIQCSPAAAKMSC